MNIQLNKIIFFLVIFIINFQNSFTHVSYKKYDPNTNKWYDHSFNAKLGLGDKILLDMKYKTRETFVIYKEVVSLTIDIEGKVYGYKDVSFKNSRGYIRTLIDNTILKKSTLWGNMKLIKV